jgi:DNA-binding NarL/FixJ family response regulator
MAERIGVVVADDHPIVRSGLILNIEHEEDLQVVGQAEDGESALSLIEKLRPQVAVLDIEMPKRDGIAICRAVRERNLDTKIIFLTLHKERDLFHVAMKAGGDAYLIKDSAIGEITTAIRSVLAGRQYVSSGILKLLLQKENPQPPSEKALLQSLSPAELRVLQLIADGRSSKEIGADLSIHYRTVENHRSNISRKLGIVGPNALPRFALQHKDKLSRLAEQA